MQSRHFIYHLIKHTKHVFGISLIGLLGSVLVALLYVKTIHSETEQQLKTFMQNAVYIAQAQLSINISRRNLITLQAITNQLITPKHILKAQIIDSSEKIIVEAKRPTFDNTSKLITQSMTIVVDNVKVGTILLFAEKPTLTLLPFVLAGISLLITSLSIALLLIKKNALLNHTDGTHGTTDINGTDDKTSKNNEPKHKGIKNRNTVLLSLSFDHLENWTKDNAEIKHRFFQQMEFYLEKVLNFYSGSLFVHIQDTLVIEFDGETAETTLRALCTASLLQTLQQQTLEQLGASQIKLSGVVQTEPLNQKSPIEQVANLQNNKPRKPDLYLHTDVNLAEKLQEHITWQKSTTENYYVIKSFSETYQILLKNQHKRLAGIQ